MTTMFDPRVQVTVPIFELDSDGSVLPNPIFHRSWDKLHSRCIEYPYAASKLGNAQRILDIGTAKADNVWIRWLDNLPIDVCATDYDPMLEKTNNLIFHQADVRSLPFDDNYFDKILAVSVIEHIGLEKAQVNMPIGPVQDEFGDEKAFLELVRVLKKGGEIIMTLPFGKQAGFVPALAARNYSEDSLDRFSAYARPIQLDYYEYQYARFLDLFIEYEQPKTKMETIKDLLFQPPKKKRAKAVSNLPFPGIVTWRKTDIKNSNSTQYGHTDGVVCGVWKKE